MNRCIRRHYTFSDRDVREILIEWMKGKDLPRPSYVGDTDTTKWTTLADGILVEWTEDDQVDVPSGKPVS